MKLHGNARTCPNSRALIARRVLDQGWSLAAAAEAAGVSEPTARKWVRRASSGEPLEGEQPRWELHLELLNASRRARCARPHRVRISWRSVSRWSRGIWSAGRRPV